MTNDPWGTNDPTYFGLFQKDGRLNDFVDKGEGKGRDGLRLHRLTEGTNGCISAQCEVSTWKSVVNWIKGTETTKFRDSDGIKRTKYGEVKVIQDAPKSE